MTCGVRRQVGWQVRVEECCLVLARRGAEGMLTSKKPVSSCFCWLHSNWLPLFSIENMIT